MLDLIWMEKLIISEKITIDYVDIGLSCMVFVLGMLHPFIHLSQIAESPLLSKSSSLRAIQSPSLSLQRLRVPLQEETPQPTEVEEPLIEISIDLPSEPTMELLLSSPAMRVSLSLRLHDTYDHLHIFLRQTCSQKIKLFMVQSTIGSVFSGDHLP